MAVRCSGPESGSGSVLPIGGPSLFPRPGSSLEVINPRRNWARDRSNGAKSALGGAAQPCALEIRAQAAQLTRVTFPLHSTIFSSNATRSRETQSPAPTLRRVPRPLSNLHLAESCPPTPDFRHGGEGSGCRPASVFSTQIWERVSGSGEGGAGWPA